MAVRYTDKEKAYILRVAGAVPVEIIARQIKRPRRAVSDYCARAGISIRVKPCLMEKYWPDVIKEREKKRMSVEIISEIAGIYKNTITGIMASY